MRAIPSLIAAGLLAAAAPAAQAATRYNDPTTGAPNASPGELTITFDGGAGAATATFDILGYLTLDGDYDYGPYDDTFTLKVNGTDIYSALCPLGGLGVTTVTLAPAGATQAVTNNGLNLGGVARISVPITLVEGANSLKFTYAGIAQGTGDEAWALSNLTVTGNAPAPTGVGGVPEPATWAMMTLGFLGAGATLRRRRRLMA